MHVNEEYNTDLQAHLLLLSHLLLLLHLQYRKHSFRIYYQQPNRPIFSKWNKNTEFLQGEVSFYGYCSSSIYQNRIDK